MENFDISHLPQPVHDAALNLLETLVQAFPAEAVLVHVPSAATPPRFPRSATELLVLEALEAIAPAPASPQQLAMLICKPHLEVRAILQGLALLDAVGHPAKGLYRDRRVADNLLRPSARFAAQISSICAPSGKE